MPAEISCDNCLRRLPIHQVNPYYDDSDPDEHTIWLCDGCANNNPDLITNLYSPNRPHRHSRGATMCDVCGNREATQDVYMYSTRADRLNDESNMGEDVPLCDECAASEIGECSECGYRTVTSAFQHFDCGEHAGQPLCHTCYENMEPTRCRLCGGWCPNMEIVFRQMYDPDLDMVRGVEVCPDCREVVRSCIMCHTIPTNRSNLHMFKLPDGRSVGLCNDCLLSHYNIVDANGMVYPKTDSCELCDVSTEPLYNVRLFEGRGINGTGIEYWLCDDCIRNEIFTCEDCNCQFPSGEMWTFPEGRLQGNQYCSECYNAIPKDRCNDCRITYPTEELDTVVLYDGRKIKLCPTCIQDFAKCTRCGFLFFNTGTTEESRDFIRKHGGVCPDCQIDEDFEHNLVLSDEPIECHSCGETDQHRLNTYRLNQTQHPATGMLMGGRNYILCDECRDTKLKKCTGCGTRVFEDDAYQFFDDDGIPINPDEYYCMECFESISVACYECDNQVRTSEANQINMYDDPHHAVFVCDQCQDIYHRCPRCGNYYRDTDGPGTNICPLCETRGFVLGSLDGNQFANDPKYISNQHEFGIPPRRGLPWSDFYCWFEQEPLTPLYGIELEVDQIDGFDVQYHSVSDEIGDRFFPDIYQTRDLSLQRFGIEFISNPCSIQYHEKSIPWSEITQIVKDGGYYSHDASRSCGLHIHISDEFVISRQKHIFIFLFEYFYDQMVVLSRRTKFQAERWANSIIQSTGIGNHDVLRRFVDDYGIREFDIRSERSGSKFWICNTKPASTTEIRIFRGTLDPKRLYQSLGVVDAIVGFAKVLSEKHPTTLSDNDLLDYTWGDFVKYTKDLYPNRIVYDYIVEKGLECDQGENI